MGSGGKTLRVFRREQTADRRARARAAGMCVICFVTPGTPRVHCPAGEVGGNWCTAAPPHEHEVIAPMSTCAGCRKKKAAAKARPTAVALPL